MRMVLYFFEYGLNAADDIAQRIQQYTAEYIDTITPPLTKALFNYVREGKYTFCTPGHMAGTAFQKPGGLPVLRFLRRQYPEGRHLDFGYRARFAAGSHRAAPGGRRVYRAYLQRRAELSGHQRHLHRQQDRRHVFGAGRQHGADRPQLPQIAVSPVDDERYRAVYLRPLRNAYGILGGIPQREFTRESIAARVQETQNATWPVHAVITNSTYDGLLYNTDYIKQTLEVPSIHFDSAWVPYTNFHPIYDGKSGMSGERVPGKVFYETQSTHKLLAAFSQASMIHIKGDYDEHLQRSLHDAHHHIAALWHRGIDGDRCRHAARQPGAPLDQPLGGACAAFSP